MELVGTTSACAENTRVDSDMWTCGWNYLRVRGEYLASTVTVPGPSELPPRARRIRFARVVAHLFAGTTSACAENTGRNICPKRYWRNYLRVRGEYPDRISKS